ncbi:fish-egg lectin-like [Megalobrama amblycephala]|uniref:fish-egg lectin-like n=1 Tax=Megalobrama amblycephala TaxID=75352 RepID=UPI002013E197|nr:fish-egg lectin-like [Megalobrama amblycephala]XP_048013415.1 fish-egg lectin-like [Megalobrama amblycephala]
MKVCQCILLLFSHLFLYTLAWNCEVIPGTLKQIDAGLGIVGGVNNDNEVFLFLGTSFERIGLSAKHFTVGPAGELGANSSNNVVKFVDGSFKLIPGIQFKQVDAGGDQIIVGVSPVDDVFCLNKDNNNVGPSSDAPWVQLAGKLKYYSCGPYSCWGVNSAGNVLIRRFVTGAACGGSNVFEAVTGALSMVEVATDGNVFGIDPQGNLLQRVGVSISNPFGSSWTVIYICPNGHKHVTFDLGWLYVICSDGSVRRCI